MKIEQAHPVPKRCIFFFCWIHSMAFVVSGLLAYSISFNQTLSAGIVIVVLVILAPLAAAAFSFVLSGYYRYTPAHYFTRRAAIRWVIWGGLSGLSVLSFRLNPVGACNALIGAIVIPLITLIVSYWLAFRLYPLPHPKRSEILEEGA